MRTLHVGRGVEWPLKLAAQAIGVLGMRGSGKSSLGRVYAEELFASKIPFVVFDPIGNWYGIRAGRDGRPGGGISVPIFGGDHGDLPLDRASGQKIADLVLERKLSCVLDLSHADFSEADKRRFLIDFGDRLFRKKTRESGWLTLIMEEADDYAPQTTRTTRGGGGGSTAETLGMFQRLVKRGRFKGLGALLITQRSAAINKDLLYMVGTLVVFRTTGPRDQDAVAGWVKHNALGDELLESLPKLVDGEAWVIAPEALDTIARVRFRQMSTFDTGATPEQDGDGARPATLADIDVPALSKELLAAVEKAKADDPRELRRRIAELERALKAQPVAKAAPPAKPPKVVERNVIKPALVKRMESAAGKMAAEALRHEQALSLWWKQQRELIQEVVGALRDVAGDQRAAAAPVQRPQLRAVPPPAVARKAAPRAAREVAASNGDLSGPDQRVLDSLAWWEAAGVAQPTKVQVGFMAGYRVGQAVGGTFGNILGKLRALGYVDYPGPGAASLTDTGRHVAQPPDDAPTTDALQQAIHRRLEGPESRVLSVLVKAYPDALTKQEAGARAGYQVGPAVGGTFGNILGRLRSLGLIDYPRPGEVVALPVLFLEGA